MIGVFNHATSSLGLAGKISFIRSIKIMKHWIQIKSNDQGE